MQLHRTSLCLLLLLLWLIVSGPLPLWADAPVGSAVPAPAIEQPAAPSSGATTIAPPSTEPTRPADDNQRAVPSDIQVLKERYGQDPTGVRARLGMCRRGPGGQGMHRGQNGHHRHWRGGERWNGQ